MYRKLERYQSRQQLPREHEAPKRAPEA